METKINKIPVIISIVMLFLAIPPIWPYGYYTLLRLIVCGTAIYLAYNVKKANKQGWFWLMGIIALLFNPLLPIHLNKELWSFIDFGIATLFVAYLVKNRRAGMKINKKLVKNIFIGIGAIVLIIISVSMIMDYYYQTTKYPINIVKWKYSPNEWVKSIKGDITIYGWKLRQVEDKPNTYLVSYTYASKEDKEKGTYRGWWWEVNTKESIVRNVIGDTELEKRYGLGATSDEKESNIVEDLFSQETLDITKEESKQEKRTNWRSLQIGMTQSQVRNLLGEPDRVDASSILWIYWYYQKGKVEFNKNTLRVIGWKEY